MFVYPKVCLSESIPMLAMVSLSTFAHSSFLVGIHMGWCCLLFVYFNEATVAEICSRWNCQEAKHDLFNWHFFSQLQILLVFGLGEGSRWGAYSYMFLYIFFFCVFVIYLVLSYISFAILYPGAWSRPFFWGRGVWWCLNRAPNIQVQIPRNKFKTTWVFLFALLVFVELLLIAGLVC